MQNTLLASANLPNMSNTHNSIKLLLFLLALFILAATVRKDFFLADAPYQPISHTRNKKIRKKAIFAELPEFIQVLEDITGGHRARNFAVKNTTCQLLDESLKSAGFRGIKNGTLIPITSSGQQSRLHENSKKVLKNRVTPNRMRETDLFGTFHVRLPDGGRFTGYYSTLEAIRPLLDSREWKGSITGYYLNVTGNLDAVRLSYLTTSPEQGRQVVDGFVAEHGLEYIREPSAAVSTRISAEYGGEELRFRKFLATYTQIGLDLLDYDITYARRLAAEYRLSYSPQRLSCRPLFEPALTKHSPYYNGLDSHAKAQLWRDFNYWHPRGDWLHMMVNMLLPGDWLYIPDFMPFFFGDHRPPITPELRQAMLGMFDLDIPRGWRP